MRKPTKQQIGLGWEDVVLEDMYFLCMCQVDNQKKCLSAHHALTYALRRNGNRARDWKAEGGKAKQQPRAWGTWMLTVNGLPVKLFVEYVNRDGPTPVAVDYVPIAYEKGVRGRSAEIRSIVDGWNEPS